MLANTQPVGIDVLGRLAGIAAGRASAHHGAAVVLTGCEDAGINPGLIDRDLQFEAWVVRESDHDITIAAFATVRGPAGHQQIVASGRFRFAILTNKKDPGA